MGLKISEGMQRKAGGGPHEGSWGGHQGTRVFLMCRKLRQSGEVPLQHRGAVASPACSQAGGPVSGERQERV